MPGSTGTVPVFEQILQRFPRHDSVKFRSQEKVEGLLAKLIEGKEDSLQVISDFDHTLSRHHKDGKPCYSSYGVFDFSPLLPEEFKRNNLVLYDKFHPIEICHEMSISEKIPHIIKWYESTHNELITNSGLTRSLFKRIMEGAHCHVMLRDNAVKLLETLNKANVPVLIFSAGIGNILQAIIESHDALFPNIKIISNWMEFNDSGELTHFKQPIIHTFNKNESVLGSENSYFENLSHRPNAILLGDSIGDIQMCDGMPCQNGVLKIGFLNMRIEERLESFLDVYDIVLLDDQSMDFVNLLLSFILKGTPTSQEIQ